MTLFTKQKVEPTFDQRVATVTSDIKDALGVFESVAEDLEELAAEQQGLLLELTDEVDKLLVLKAQAHASHDQATSAAEKIRALVA